MRSMSLALVVLCASYGTAMAADSEHKDPTRDKSIQAQEGVLYAKSGGHGRCHNVHIEPGSKSNPSITMCPAGEYAAGIGYNRGNNNRLEGVQLIVCCPLPH